MPLFAALFAIWQINWRYFLALELPGIIYCQKYRQKFRLGARGQNYGVATTLLLQGLARVGERS
jgi:hypothetical protein